MKLVRRGPRGRARGGYALLLIVSVLAMTGLLIGLVALDATLSARTGRLALAERRVAALAEAAHETFLATGTLPGDTGQLVSLSQSTNLELVVADPFGALEDLDLRVAGDLLRVSSRGPDGRLGTSDDVVTTLPVRTPGRARTRNRLRLLRALASRSAYLHSGLVAPGDRAALLQAMRSYATESRKLDYVTGAEAVAAQEDVDDARATIESIVAAYGLPPMPSSATGSGGLLEALGLPDTLGTDGYGRTFATEVVGPISLGRDGTEGTSDDF